MNSNHFWPISFLRLFVTLAGLPAMLRIALQAGLLCSGVLVSRAATNYVAQGGQTPVTNYTSWATAASNIQDAISVAGSGDTVLVSNGVYEVGGITNWPAGTVLTNRVAIYKAITVRSANNDPTNTIIKGARDPVSTYGPAAARCVYMTNGSSLIGFTLTNGATLVAGAINDLIGGGVWSPSANTVISNCVLTGNSSTNGGGGAYQGALYNCTLIGNSTLRYGGGVSASTLSNCTLTGNSAGLFGGGTYQSTLHNCALIGNSAGYGAGVYQGAQFNCTLIGNSGIYGGGANKGAMYNCALISNSASQYGGGTLAGTLSNCTLIGNSAGLFGGGAYQDILYNCLLARNLSPRGGGAYGGTQYNCTVANNTATNSGGGVSTSALYNCIVYFNTAPAGSNWQDIAAATNSCTAPAIGGVGNITANPLFVDTNTANYRLNANSPGINTGTNMNWMTNSYDLDGRTRIRYGTVDMGAYETLYKGTICSFH